MYMCVCVCVCSLWHTIAQESAVSSLESRISSLVACAQSIPNSHYAANASERARERQRVSCWQIAWRLTHSATCCPSAPLPLPDLLPCCTSHFMCVNISKSPSALRAKWFTCQAMAPIPPPLSTLLPLANSLQFLHLQLPHTHTQRTHSWHSLLYGAAALSTFAWQVLLSCSGDFVVVVAAPAAATRLCHRNLITNIVATVKINNRFQEELLLLFASPGCLGI